MPLTERERYQSALHYIEKFESGEGIDWGQVETVFTLVKPLVELHLDLLDRHPGPVHLDQSCDACGAPPGEACHGYCPEQST